MTELIRNGSPCCSGRDCAGRMAGGPARELVGLRVAESVRKSWNRHCGGVCVRRPLRNLCPECDERGGIPKDPASAACVVVVVASSALPAPPAPGPRAGAWGNCVMRTATRRRHAVARPLMVQDPPSLRGEWPHAERSRSHEAGAQFFHQPLTVSTAWAPKSDSAEWAFTRPEDRRAAWKRDATFSQFTRFHQALT